MPVSDEDLFDTVPELGEKLRDGEFTSRELTEAYLDRLEEIGPKLNAVVTTTEERALEYADRADAELANGVDRGPLHGIPYGLKDLVAVDGYETTWGAAPYRDQEFDYNAEIVERFDDAGAVLVAKLAMVELAGGMGYSPDAMSFTGTAYTPWNLDVWSGGSSSGPGAATAAGLVGFSIGSETWGSIFSPSGNCGLSGLRPTYGAISRYGAMALSYTMDKLGPMCRSAEGCEMVFEAIAGPDPKDHTSLDRMDTIRSLEPSDPVRLATLDLEADDTNFQDSLETLREFAEIEEISLPDLPYGETASLTLFAEAGSVFDDLIESGDVQDLTSPQGSIGGYAYDTILAKDYITANRIRRKIQVQLDEAMAPYDAVVLPNRALGGAANIAGLPGISIPNGFDEEGVPTALIFTGRAFSDLKLAEIAKEYQSRAEGVDYTELLDMPVYQDEDAGAASS
ncbi:amidase [Halosimplex rubrum]|uniref:Amidase n=1 Tax=Halosimplex rubrum TaxID=869889 RepID=A0A7D5P9A3_9EURY|nr:amidase [Halosimplex rubrum]QLH77500.1 amidase [Halosimplex rubrum]